MVVRDEDDSMLDVKHIEEMMRASQKSNIFTIVPPDSNERGTAVKDSTASMMSKSVVMQDSSDRYSVMQQQLSRRSSSRVEVLKKQQEERDRQLAEQVSLHK